MFGASGSGTTTLGREAAKRLGFPHFELDDYLFYPDTEIPCSAVRPREERIRLLMSDISKYPHFVMSGSMDSYNATFVPMFGLAALVFAPAEIRAERIAPGNSPVGETECSLAATCMRRTEFTRIIWRLAAGTIRTSRPVIAGRTMSSGRTPSPAPFCGLTEPTRSRKTRRGSLNIFVKPLQTGCNTSPRTTRFFPAVPHASRFPLSARR